MVAADFDVHAPLASPLRSPDSGGGGGVRRPRVRRRHAAADEMQLRLAAVRQQRGLPPTRAAERVMRDVARRLSHPSAAAPERENIPSPAPLWSIVASEVTSGRSRETAAREEKRFFDTEAALEAHVNETCFPGSPIPAAHARSRGGAEGGALPFSFPPGSPMGSPSCSPRDGSPGSPAYGGPFCRLFPGVRPARRRARAEQWARWVAALDGLLRGEPAEELLSQQELLDVLAALKTVAAKEPPCPTVSVGRQEGGFDEWPLMIVGDLHGQRADLLQSVLGPFLRGERAPTQLLFLGDYVDRGADGVGVLATVALLKVLFPALVTVLRGNHEDPSVNSIYGFYNECDARYPVSGDEQQEIWAHANVAFAALPVAAVVAHADVVLPHDSSDDDGGDGGGDQQARAATAATSSGPTPQGFSRRRIFCCHGGLCPALVPDTGGDGEAPGGAGPSALDIIGECERRKYGGTGGDPSQETKAVLDGLLWSDPTDVWFPSLFKDSVRGTGWQWSADASRVFCERNGFDVICRAHECVTEGVQWSHGGLVVTVFSAANYCGSSGNRGGVLHISTDWGFSTIDYDAAEGKAAGGAAAQPLLKYFRPGMEPVQLPRVDGVDEQRAAAERAKAEAVGREDFAEATQQKRVLCAMQLAAGDGQWHVQGVDPFLLPDGVDEDADGRITMSFVQLGGTVVGTYAGCDEITELSIGSASQAGLAVGVKGKFDLTIRGDTFTYDGKMDREGNVVTGEWTTTDGERGKFTLTRLLAE